MAARTTPEWLERMRDVRVLDVARELGVPTAAPKGSSGGSVYGCPACGGERRHTKTGDKRGALGITREGQGWRCFQCDASGDALDFVALTRRGGRFGELGEAAKADVREWCQRWLGLEPGNPSTPRPKPPTRPVAPPAPPPKPEPAYPPAHEVRALWDACVRVDADEEASTSLRRRTDKRGFPAPIDPTAVADMDLARAIPSGITLPTWASWWPSSGYRIVAPLVNAHGAVRSLRARNVRPELPRRRDGSPMSKAVAASGYEVKGLVFACPLARQVLSRGARPEWWPDDRALRIYVCEGDTDFLLTAVGPRAGERWTEADECAPAAVLGIESGAWTRELADRVPDGSLLVIATDADKAGDRYAEQDITPTVRARLVAGQLGVERWRPMM